MENELFNLIDKPWVPVLMRDGSTRKVSLMEVFVGGANIADLALNPYERIAVMRLLICIAIAALQDTDLQDESAWKQCLVKLPLCVPDYLRKWHNRFNLYGEKAFLQPDGLVAKLEGKACRDKLFPHLSSGNNATLFDHQASLMNREITAAQLVIGLLTYLNFSAGGRHAKCTWSAEETSASVSLCPCREKSMLHTMLLGDNLLTTVWLNLITRDMADALPQKTFGRPIWELNDLNRTSVEGKGIEQTILGRLVPLSRVIKLARNDQLCIMGEGLKYDQLPAAREVMASTFLRKDQKGNEMDAYVSASKTRQPWRDLQAILAKTAKHGTPILQHLKTLQQNDEFIIWTGGLVANQGKDEAVVEWTARLSTALLTDSALITYTNGIKYAESCSKKLHLAVAEYAGACKGFEAHKKKPMERDSLSQAYTVPAKQFFWDELSLVQPLLTAIAEGREDTNLKDWNKCVREVARSAYEYACPKMSGRQMTAYVKGLKVLVDKKETEYANN